MAENPANTSTESAKSLTVEKPWLWKKGAPSPNPHGRKRTGYQDLATRREVIAQRYSFERLDQICTTPALFRKLSTRDAVLFREAHEAALEKRDQARKDYLDRSMGKAAITVRHGGAPEHGPINIGMVPTDAASAKAAYQALQGMAIKQPENDEAVDAEFTEVDDDLPDLPSPGMEPNEAKANGEKKL